MHVLYNCSRSPPKAFIVRPWLRQVLSWPPKSLSVDRPFVSLEEEEHSFFLPPLGFFRDPKGKEKMFLCRAELLPSAGSSSVFFMCSFLFRRAIVIAWRRWGSFLFPTSPYSWQGLEVDRGLLAFPNWACVLFSFSRRPRRKADKTG